MWVSHALQNSKSQVTTLKQLLLADLNCKIRNLDSDLNFHWVDCEGSLPVTIYLQKMAFWGVLTTWFPACKSKTIVPIHNPSDKSSTSIPTLRIRRPTCEIMPAIINPWQLLFWIFSSKLQPCGHTAMACMRCQWCDVTIQVLIDRRHER